MLLAPGLDPSRCRLGYRVLSNRRVVARGSILGDRLQWTDDGAWRRGVGGVDFPQAAVLQCFASYGECAQHHYWIADPRTFQNPMRMTLQVADSELEVLRDYLFEEKRQRKESRDFETGVALLAWMLGFSSAHLGSTPRLSDAPDIVGTTPKGDMLIIECTTGLLKAENKLSKLIERARAIRSNLDASGNGHVRVLPVIVSALERGAVDAERRLAIDSGVGVATRETLQEMLLRTIGVADSQLLFDEIWNSLHPIQ